MFFYLFQDFEAVLRLEPANSAAQEELKKVAVLIQNEKAKVCISCFRSLP
jgi:hypothetical protein